MYTLNTNNIILYKVISCINNNNNNKYYLCLVRFAAGIHLDRALYTTIIAECISIEHRACIIMYIYICMSYCIQYALFADNMIIIYYSYGHNVVVSSGSCARATQTLNE